MAKSKNNEKKLPANFKNLLKDSYKPKVSASAIHKFKNPSKVPKLGGLQRDPLSTNDTKVYYDPLKKQPIIVHRGTTNSLNDYISDGLIAIGAGKLSPRYWTARRMTHKVEKKYGKKAAQYGHSLGGWLAENAASKNAQVYTYNKHALGYAGVTTNPNQVDVRTRKDIVSFPSLFRPGSDRIIEVPTKETNPITAHYLDSLPDY